MSNIDEKQIELVVRRLLAGEEVSFANRLIDNADKHRGFLQGQFKWLTWCIGIIFTAGILVFGFLFGKSYETTKKQMAEQVDQKVIEYRIVDVFKQRLEEQVKILVNSEELTRDISQKLSAEAAKQVSDNADEVIRKMVEEHLAKLDNQDIESILEKLVNSRFDQLEARLTEVDKSVNELGTRLGGLELRVALRSSAMGLKPVNTSTFEEILKGLEK